MSGAFHAVEIHDLVQRFGSFTAVDHVNFTIPLPQEMQHHFNLVASAVVLFALTCTVLMAQWETRDLRRALRLLRGGQPVDPELGMSAGRQAVDRQTGQ